jgi:cell shape-determining protein MreC
MIKLFIKVILLLLLSLQTLQSSFYYPENNLINHLTHTQVGSEATIQATNGDRDIQASSIQAEGDIDLQATNNITIKEAKESRTTNTKESHAKTELNIVIKNEYEQIRHSMDNLKSAKESLQSAKADYEKYKKDLKDQESKLVL